MNVLELTQSVVDTLAAQWNAQAEVLHMPPVFEDGELNPEYRLTPTPRLSFGGLKAWVKHLPTERELVAKIGLWQFVKLVAAAG